MTRADFNRKVRSLLTLADPGSGGTAPERVTARAMADKMMKEYGIPESEIPLRDGAPERPRVPQSRPRPTAQTFTVNMNAGGFGFTFHFDNNQSTGSAW